MAFSIYRVQIKHNGRIDEFYEYGTSDTDAILSTIEKHGTPGALVSAKKLGNAADLLDLAVKFKREERLC